MNGMAMEMGGGPPAKRGRRKTAIEEGCKVRVASARSVIWVKGDFLAGDLVAYVVELVHGLAYLAGRPRRKLEICACVARSGLVRAD